MKSEFDIVKDLLLSMVEELSQTLYKVKDDVGYLYLVEVSHACNNYCLEVDYREQRNHPVKLWINDTYIYLGKFPNMDETFDSVAWVEHNLKEIPEAIFKDFIEENTKRRELRWTMQK